MKRLELRLRQLNITFNHLAKNATKAMRATLVKLLQKIFKLEAMIEAITAAKTVTLTKAQAITRLIELITTETGKYCSRTTASYWSKYGKERIYLGRNNGVRDNGYGYIDISDNEIKLIKVTSNSGSSVMNKAKWALEQLKLPYSYIEF